MLLFKREFSPLLSQSSLARFKMPVVIGVIVFLSALFGIFTRPIDLLANLWPANAILLGAMLRFPGASSAFCWLFAIAGYLGADLLTGSSLEKTLVLTAGNLVAVSTGILFARKVIKSFDSLDAAYSTLNLILVALVASVAAGLSGMLIYPYLFDGSVKEGLMYWFISELVHYVAFLPIILSFPKQLDFNFKLSRKLTRAKLLHIVPGASVFVLCWLALVIGLPDVAVVPVLGLLWCALTYPVFVTSALTLFYCLWIFTAVSLGYVGLHLTPANWQELMFLRLSVAIIALVPIVISSYMQARRTEFAKLEYVANHDSLTGALNRRAFINKLQTAISQQNNQSIALLMIDLDFFKSVNDQFGHPIGDAMLKHFYQIAENNLRRQDRIGRIGGEEFAVLLTGHDAEQAEEIADRIRGSFAEQHLELENGQHLFGTVSIGIALANETNSTIESLLKQADIALYQAKSSGRNKAVFYQQGDSALSQ